ncbi:hypothetical protein AQJ30_27435 [Streptomyces longwoodensis]|uniref:Uncharacterized protein n=1 Tax=Streptomyces longwoodensis TaxID=68231 RepID=A0A124HQB1_9ACTN|nr:hypothetical protein [Streptomyces longwoodensis]KUN34809.1 hypothetical protein AQJ30_27435 [Streptomyces longwoodensis]
MTTHHVVMWSGGITSWATARHVIAEHGTASTTWVRLLEVFPERYARAEAAEAKMRRLLGKDVSILRDRRGGATKPLTLAALRRRIEEQPDQLDLFDEGGCGCFTELAA